MRRRVAWLVAATTSAVVLAFVIPLCLLVRTMAEDRGMAAANQEARNVAILVSGLHDDPRLGQLISAVERRGPAQTSVLTSDGRVLGDPSPGMATRPSVRRAAAGNAFTRVDGSGGEILVPVVTAAGTDVVRTTVPAGVLHRGVVRAWVGIGLLGLLLLVAAVVIADRIARRVSTPVTAVADVAHRLRGGELDARAEPAGPPETRELGIALNLLAERITELLAAERSVVGDLSHRLRTPVTALRLDAEGLDQPEIAERLQEHIGHLQRTIDAIVKEARRPVRHNMSTSCDAGAVIRERIGFWSALCEDQDRSVTVEVAGDLRRVAVDARDLRDLLDILVDNVFAHTPEGTAFRIELTGGTKRVVLRVSDDGPGLPERPAAPTDRPGSTGLGLQIVRRTAAGFGGEAVIRSAPGHGVLAEVRMPTVTPAEKVPHRQSSDPRPE